MFFYLGTKENATVWLYYGDSILVLCFVILNLQMYVNPIHEAVQLCPSMEYIDSAGSKKRNSNGAVKEGSSNGAIRLRQQVLYVVLANSNSSYSQILMQE